MVTETAEWILSLIKLSQFVNVYNASANKTSTLPYFNNNKHTVIYIYIKIDIFEISSSIGNIGSNHNWHLYHLQYWICKAGSYWFYFNNWIRYWINFVSGIVDYRCLKNTTDDLNILIEINYWCALFLSWTFQFNLQLIGFYLSSGIVIRKVYKSILKVLTVFRSSNFK